MTHVRAKYTYFTMLCDGFSIVIKCVDFHSFTVNQIYSYTKILQFLYLILILIYVTRFVKTRHNSAFIEINLLHLHVLDTKNFLL